MEKKRTKDEEDNLEDQVVLNEELDISGDSIVNSQEG